MCAGQGGHWQVQQSVFILENEAAAFCGDVPVLTVCNKADYSRDIEADYYMSVTEDEGVEAVVAAAVDAIDYEPELPFEAAE